MRLEPVGESVDVDHDPLDALGLQPIEQMIDQRLARDLDQGFGPIVRQWPHAGAEARGQHHGGLGGLAAQARFSGGT